MQLPRETPGEVLPPAVCVHAGVGAGGYLSRPLPSREFREPPGSAAAEVAWLGDKALGSAKPVPGRSSPRAGRRAAAAPRARWGRGLRGSSAPREPQGQRGSSSEGERGH